MNLGEDLEIEIFLRLPGKSLARLKCVQKSWNNLIKSPHFMNIRNKLPRNPSLLIIEKPKLKPLNMKLLSYDSDNKKPIRLKSLFPYKVEKIKMYGSCNGVFCLKGIYRNRTRRDRLILWNPTTTEVHLIPRAPSLIENRSEYLYGFGAVNGDFKVVHVNVSNSNGRMKMLYLLSAEVYDLSTKSWTPPILKFPPHTVVERRKPSRYNTLVNGVYHWITSSDCNNAAEILCYDFGNNQFRKLEAPNIRAPFFRDDVIEIKGSLGYVVQYRNSSMVWLKIWIMEQNGWAKKYNFDPTRSMFCIYGIWNDGVEILGAKVKQQQQQLTSYDHHGNALRQLQIDILDLKNGYFWIYEYVPSIALLHGHFGLKACPRV